MDLDTKILNIDIYRTQKDELISLLNGYNIKCTEADRQDELRAIAVNLKKQVKDSVNNPLKNKLVYNVLFNYNAISDEEIKQHKDLELILKAVKDRDRVYYIPPDACQLTSAAQYKESDNLYEDIGLNNKQTKVKQISIENYLEPVKKMAENLPLISAGYYSGTVTENPNDFIDRYLLTATANTWSNESILRLFPTHLKSHAFEWYKMFINKHKTFSWDQLKTAFITAFTPVAQAENLHLIMDRKIQGNNDSTLNYFLDIVTTCRRYDPQIGEKQIINYVLQGLKPQICEYISTLNNDTLEHLESNLLLAERYILTNLRNKEKYSRETTRENTTLNQTTENRQEFLSNSLNLDHADLSSQIKNLTNIVANLQLTTQYRGRDRVRNQNDDYRRSYSRSPSANNYNRNTAKSPSFNNHKGDYDKKYYRDSSRDRIYGHRKQSLTPTVRISVPGRQQRLNNDGGLFCKICRMSNHNTESCWHNRNNSNGAYKKRNFQDTSNSGSRNLWCNYCKLKNHNIQNCFKLSSKKDDYKKNCY